MSLDPESCYRAVQSRDARFDGRFFTAVKTTGIFCRPICPAVTPKPENCTFFLTAAAAHQAGFRPCLRCRPELSPHLFAHVNTGSTVAKALQYIAAGALDEGSVETLAQRLGVSDRHLRQLFTQHLGTTPTAIARTRRLLFAKQLIDETQLPMTDVAMAAGFTSIRRFNDCISQTYGRSPSQLRLAHATDHSVAKITLKLPYRPPYSWTQMIQFWAARSTPGLETVSQNRYQRAIALEGHHGLLEVCAVPQQSYLLAQIHFPQVSLLGSIVDRLRHLFDLNAPVDEIAIHLRQDSLLQPLVDQNPGLRIPGHWDSFELAIRAILGQQVSVAAATTMAGRLVNAYGEPLQIPEPTVLQWVYPRPEVLAAADLTTIGLTRPKAKAIAALAAKVAEQPQFLHQFQSLEDAVEQLCQLPGIGEWTAQYIAMRSLREPDAFPSSDLGLLRSMSRLGKPVTPVELLDRAESWRPWRAYGAMHLWAFDSTFIPTQEISA
jgi:AraC family transcriptional regulator, regulatory protein of adaptative response / DNA-3-methyladenine glycosylase II